MQYPERFSALSGYPFPRLRALLQDIPAGGEPLYMSLGEPKHAFPPFVMEEISKHQKLFNNYPKNNGEPPLLDAIIGYLSRRFGIDNIGHDNLTPLNGTREGLYMAALALLPERKNGKAPIVLAPNPFYQVYMMGAKTLGLDTQFVNTTAETKFLPDYESLPAATLDRTCAVFLCSPSNPQGAIADSSYLKSLILLAERHDFLIFADECYCELFFGDAPNSAFKVAQDMGADTNRIVAFHSLSKRSNLPGLRSGFAVSGKKTMAKLHQLRGYAGAPVAGPIQMVSAKLWADDKHVVINRALYAEKMKDVRDILGQQFVPEGGFFLWLPTQNGETTASTLWKEQGIEVLPGEYLCANIGAQNPGTSYIRVAMVGPHEKTKQAIKKIEQYLN